MSQGFSRITFDLYFLFWLHSCSINKVDISVVTICLSNIQHLYALPFDMSGMNYCFGCAVSWKLCWQHICSWHATCKHLFFIFHSPVNGVSTYMQHSFKFSLREGTLGSQVPLQLVWHHVSISQFSQHSVRAVDTPVPTEVICNSFYGHRKKRDPFFAPSSLFFFT